MSRAFRFPLWTPRSFPDTSQRWLLDEPEALRRVLQMVGVQSPERFQFGRRRAVHRTVTFPSFTLRASDLFFSVPWRTARESASTDVYVALENESAPAGLARVRAACLAGGVWQDDWARWEREAPRGQPFQPLFLLPVLFYTGDEPWSGPAELAETCRVPAELRQWAPKWPVAFVDLKRHPEDRLAELGPFGSVLGLLQAERAPAAEFARRLQQAIRTIEPLPPTRRALGRRWLWYLYALVHHRRPVTEHTTWREMVQSSVQRQKLREEVQLTFGVVPAGLHAWLTETRAYGTGPIAGASAVAGGPQRPCANHDHAAKRRLALRPRSAVANEDENERVPRLRRRLVGGDRR